MIKKTILIVFTIFFVLLSQSIQSQKIVVLNLEYIINNSNQYQEIIKKILKAQELKKNNFEKDEETIKSKQNEIENSKLILSKDEFKLKVDEYNEILSNFKDSIDEFNFHYDNQILKIRNQILEKIVKLLEKYAIEKKIDLIFDNKNYIIASNSIDITDIILKELDTLDLKLKFDSL